MRQLKKDLKALKQDLKKLTQKTEQMIKNLEKLEKTKVKKICFTCGQWKRIEEFHNSDKTKDGKLGRCKKCISEYRKSYQKTHKNEIVVSNFRLNTCIRV